MQFGTPIIHIYVTKLISLLLVKKKPVMSTLKSLYATGKSVNTVNYRSGLRSFSKIRDWTYNVVPQVVLCSLQNNSTTGDYETATTGAVMTEPDVRKSTPLCHRR